MPLLCEIIYETEKHFLSKTVSFEKGHLDFRQPMHSNTTTAVCIPEILKTGFILKSESDE